jgi:hypothetical protein
VALPVREAGFLGGGSVDQWQTLQITIRYYIADRPDGWTDVHDLAASDSAAIFEALMESDQWTGTQAEGAALGDAVPLTRSPTIANMGFQVLNYRVLYNRCKTGSGGSFSAHFFTLGALLAYLDTKPKSTVAKLVNARTREIIGVWVKDAIEASYCDFSLADGTEFADGTDLIKQAGASYTITYGTGIVIAGGAVEFYGFGRLANSDLLYTGTTTTYQREKLHKYTTQGDIDAVTGATDQVVGFVGADGVLVNHQRWDGSSWGALYLQGDVPGFASTAAMEAATLYGEEVGSIGGSIYQMIGGTATQLTAAAAAASGYTSAATLLSQPGQSGDMALLWESPGGNPLVWYRYHDGISGNWSGWFPDEFIFENLTAAEQAVWDALLEGTSDAVTWGPNGIIFSGVAVRHHRFSGLFDTAANGLALANMNRLNFTFEAHGTADEGTSGGAYVWAGVCWGTPSNPDALAVRLEQISGTNHMRVGAAGVASGSFFTKTGATSVNYAGLNVVGTTESSVQGAASGIIHRPTQMRLNQGFATQSYAYTGTVWSPTAGYYASDWCGPYVRWSGGSATASGYLRRIRVMLDAQ